MRVNGKTIALTKKQTLLALLTAEQFDCKTIAVEHNGRIVPKTEYENILLADDDTLEVVQFVGGG